MHDSIPIHAKLHSMALSIRVTTPHALALTTELVVSAFASPSKGFASQADDTSSLRHI